MTGPGMDMIEAAAREIDGAVLRTPVLPLSSAKWDGILPPEAASVTLKLEMFQQSGSFKARGALLAMRRLTAEERAAGVVAASGGNHALAVCWAAKAAGVDALITMPSHVDQSRIDGCRALGATVELYEDMPAAFAAMDAAAQAGRKMLHPFEGEAMCLGAATVGREYLEQTPEADLFIVPVGGGGLIAGMSRAIKLIKPEAQVIGVEPTGADALSRSFEEGRPVRLDRVETIADSLSAPMAMPYSYAVARAHVDEMVRITDAQMRQAMGHYQKVLRLMAEPACAASLAALLGPLRARAAGRHVALIACGSNISLSRLSALMADA